MGQRGRASSFLLGLAVGSLGFIRGLPGPRNPLPPVGGPGAWPRARVGGCGVHPTAAGRCWRAGEDGSDCPTAVSDMAEKEKISHKLLLHPGEGELTAQRVAEQFNPHQVLVEKQRGALGSAASPSFWCSRAGGELFPAAPGC